MEHMGEKMLQAIHLCSKPKVCGVIKQCMVLYLNMYTYTKFNV